jgi:hypothetical protein
MEKSKVPLKLGFLALSCGMLTVLSQGCSTATSSPKLASGGLKFTNGLSDEPQLSRAISRFCDSAYIAVNESQEITSEDVLGRYERIRAARGAKSGAYAIAELTKASLISNKRTDVVMKRFDELQKRIGKKHGEEIVADLAKASIITDKDASDVEDALDAIESSRRWKHKSSAVELTKLVLFTDRDADDVLATYDEFKTRQGRTSGEHELVELTKSATLTGRAPNDLVRMFDTIEKLDKGFVDRDGTAELVKVALLTNSSPKTVYYRYADIKWRKGRQPASVRKEHDRAVELLKLSLLGKRTPDDVVKLYDRLLGGVSAYADHAKPIALSLITGETLQDSVWGAHADECNGGYARLILSIDAYHSDEG